METATIVVFAKHNGSDKVAQEKHDAAKQIKISLLE
jgi:hypothetical protein